MISYRFWQDAPADFHAEVAAWVARHPSAAICDVGGGANPSVPLELRRDRRYLVLDIDSDELAKCPDDVEHINADITSPAFVPPGKFALVISRQVAEHVTDAERFHLNVRSMLNPDGIAMHYFPTLWTLPFILNRVVPEAFSEKILLRVQPGRAKGGHHAKFPARYEWCRGPTRPQLKRLQRCGYRVERYTGYFGHGYYRSISRPLTRLEDLKAAILLRFPVAALTAYATMTLRRI